MRGGHYYQYCYNKIAGVGAFLLRNEMELRTGSDLDEEFKQTISQLKPYAKLLPHKSGINIILLRG